MNGTDLLLALGDVDEGYILQSAQPRRAGKMRKRWLAAACVLLAVTALGYGYSNRDMESIHTESTNDTDSISVYVTEVRIESVATDGYGVTELATGRTLFVRTGEQGWQPGDAVLVYHTQPESGGVIVAQRMERKDEIP